MFSSKINYYKQLSSNPSLEFFQFNIKNKIIAYEVNQKYYPPPKK